MGLRGATPIILATFPVVAGIPNGQIFDVVFFVVLTSVLVQGTTIPIVARRLGLATGRLPAGTYTFDAVITGDAGHNLREVVVGPSAPAIGQPIVSLGLPPGALVVLVYRGDQHFVPQGGTVLEAGDRLLLLAEGAAWARARQLLAGDEEP